jgi:hypothetical protein
MDTGGWLCVRDDESASRFKVVWILSGSLERRRSLYI